MKGKLPSNVKVTQQVWEELQLFFVQHRAAGRAGIGKAQAAKKFSISVKTIENLWYHGSPSLGKPAMKTLMNDADVMARAARAKMRDDQLKAAEAEINAIVAAAGNSDAASSLRDAAEARAHEGLLVAVSRQNLIGIQGVYSRILRAIMDGADSIEAEVRAMTPKQKIAFIKEFAKMMNDSNSALKMVMETERLLMGEPTEIIGISNRNMSQKDAARILNLATRTHNRMLIDGTAETTESKTVALSDASEPDLPEPDLDDEERAEGVGAEAKAAVVDIVAEEAVEEDAAGNVSDDPYDCPYED
jgi:hypothetical protein